MAESTAVIDLNPAPSLGSLSSTQPSPRTGLTTFPNLFADEPEPGLLPALLSKVKSTFAASTATPLMPSIHPIANKPTDKGPTTVGGEGNGSQQVLQPQSEAQAIAEAAKDRANHLRKLSVPATKVLISPVPSLRILSEPSSARPSPTTSIPVGSSLRQLKPLLASNPSSSTQVTQNLSVAPSSSSAQTRPFLNPLERKWRASGASPAQVTVSSVTSVTATISSYKPDGELPSIMGPPLASNPKVHRTHFGLQNAVASSSRSSPLLQHAHSNSLGGLRGRRGSIATIPDSASSVSLSAMITANAELSYVPGFPLGNEDTRSVRSVVAVKKSGNSVSRIIRRMRGEGLSKHYWMADESCRECYDCRSVFTAWRRKHHCRICGQIFCSRCASNIIGARRFGQEGAVRVCNLCLKIMESYKDEDDDDRRSIASMATTARLPSMSEQALLEAAMSPAVPYAKSPFAASQLFSTNPNESLDAIDEGFVSSRWDGSQVDLDRPDTPNDIGGSQISDVEEVEDNNIFWATRPNTAAPFRRPLDHDPADDDAADDTPNATSQASALQSPVRAGRSPAGSRSDAFKVGMKLNKIGFPRTETISTEGGFEIRAPLGRIDSLQPLIGLRTRLSSRASQGGLTALLEPEKSEGLWRARSRSFAQRPELLSGASLRHFDTMLEQAIARADLPNPSEWHASLRTLLLKVSTDLLPNVRAGDSIDVRAFVKIKKIPGGKVSDSEYVDGIVISKNVAHKAMPRRLVNPRIMVITFPLDYHRVEHQFMSLDPILAQEKDYLRLLTKRIIDVRPHIVLVERSASRFALDYLLEANIAVARSVKLSAIHQVARCTQADVVASMDRLALEPRLGRCAEFNIQSYEHELIPGRRKTLMRFEGCHREYGCTLVLRGGDLATLRKAKVVADFMALVAYHLKNEIILYNDEHNILPPSLPMPAEYEGLLRALTMKEPLWHESAKSEDEAVSITDVDTPTTPTQHLSGDDERMTQKLEAFRLTREIAESVRPYLVTALSASAAIRFPPPAPLAKMAELDHHLAKLRHHRDEAEAAEILQDETKHLEPISRPPTINMNSQTQAVPADGDHMAQASLLEVPASTAMSAIPASPAPTRDFVRDPYRVLRKPEEISRESALSQAEHEHNEQLRIWDWYTKRHPAVLRPEDFQGLVYLYLLGTEGSEKPCVEPLLQHVNFYQSDDLTVGQYLEGLAIDAVKRCPSKTCERLQLFHFRLLVHGDRRLQIAMDQFPCPSPGHEDRIITWSYCRICATPSPTAILREESWKMSWGAYLEHCFYPPETPAGFSCPHDAFRDQIRYFAHRNLAIRIHNERINIYEPVRPSIALQVRAETKVLLKNQEYELALHKNAAFFDSVLFRLRSIDCDIIQPDKVAGLKSALENLLSRAVADREEMVNLLNRTYKLTPMTDVLALNTVLRTLQDKVVLWDSNFGDVEKAFLPSEKDLRRMTATHLKRLFANQDVFNSLDRNVTGTTVSEVDEKDLKITEPLSGLFGPSEPPTPALRPVGSTKVESKGDGVDEPTPLAGVTAPKPDPFAQSPTPEADDSDSTIDATRKPSPTGSPGPSFDRIESSGLDTDAGHFASRLPRRSRPAPSIADLVKRFQDSTTEIEECRDDPSSERPKSSASVHRRTSRRDRDREASDSDNALKTRPRMRRGRTEQALVRHQTLKPGQQSDGDRSYAAYASRLPSSSGSRLYGLNGAAMDRPNTLSSHSTPPKSAASLSRGASPDTQNLSGQHAMPPVPSLMGDVKPRLGGKGKLPRQLEFASGRASPGLIKSTVRRALGGSSRVTSIARHFDRLSKEAERERQKRISISRGKRARPVALTKAKVQVFDNVREAFKDESDSDSSVADNEEDDKGSDDSADSGDQSKSNRKLRSPTHSPKKISPPQRDASQPVPVASVQSRDSLSADSTGGMPISASASSITATSVLSDTRSELSFTDRLQIELPNFETAAPLPSVPATPQLSMDTADEAHHVASRLSHMSESELSSGGERSSILKTLTGLWAYRAGDYTPLEYPMSAAEHIFSDSRVIMRENEPTSIIAFTLSSKTYRDKMRSAAFNQKSKKVEAFMPEDTASLHDRTSAWDIVSLDEAIETDDPSRREGGNHLKYDFESGSSTFFCRIFFAEQFAVLRSACQCEDSFVESLSRCVQFDASGGKSGSAFLKTKDDRFIAKEISRLEMDALTKFAPAYFEYTRQSFQGQRPTVLAKIYGFFKIGYRNAITGRAMRMNVLVMENLFYERRFSKIYDLKGSTRNRLILATGRMNEVLLDENLMESEHLVYKHPLYLREHSKRILRAALYNDTLFLSNLNVMDYSLVVGVDSEKQELVIGIVDYIRTFTWDKKLESWVKDSGLLGGAGKGEPTIVTPKQYKTRFRQAMERFYFPSVPDRWTKIGTEEQPVEDEAAAAAP